MQADMLWNRIGTYSDDVLEHNWNEVSDLDAYSDDKKRKNITYIRMWWYVDSYTDFNIEMYIQINHVLNLFVFLYSTHFKAWYAPNLKNSNHPSRENEICKGVFYIIDSSTWRLKYIIVFKRVRMKVFLF